MGFIGHNVVSQLEDLGYDDITLVDNFTTYGVIPEPELNTLLLERQSQLSSVCYDYDIASSAVETAFRAVKPDLVIHLASFPRQKVVNSNPVLASATMMNGLLNLCELSTKYNVKRFVYVSSSMVYGDFNEGTSEDATCNPIGQYAIMKLAGENLVKDYGLRNCFEYTIVRPSAVYGPRDVEDRVVSKFFMAAMRNEVLKVHGADERLDFTYVTDTASGIIQASLSDNTSNRTYNITRGVSRTLLEAATIITDIMGKGTIEVKNKDTSFPSRSALSIENAKKDFEFDPKIDIEEGFKRYHEYLSNSSFWASKTAFLS
jgi:UDP-glucose 4-epimerase